jgi:WD40 repeat protein
MVSGSDDRTARIWDTTTGEVIATLKGHEDSVWLVASSGDGTLVSSRVRKGRARIWDAFSGLLVPEQEKYHPQSMEFKEPLDFDNKDGWVTLSRPGVPMRFRLCWVPPVHRLTSWRAFAWTGTNVAFGSHNGVISVLDFSSHPVMKL